MNTLPRAITAHILNNSDTYHALRRRWRELLCSERRHELSAAHHLLYSALLGRDWRRGFTPMTNRRKLENGAFYDWALFRALAILHAPSMQAELLAPFEGLITPAMLEQIRSLIAHQSPWACRPEQFAGGSFPFEAYNDSAPLLAQAQEEGKANA